MSHRLWMHHETDMMLEFDYRDDLRPRFRFGHENPYSKGEVFISEWVPVVAIMHVCDVHPDVRVFFPDDFTPIGDI